MILGIVKPSHWEEFRRVLLDWFKKNRRDLPWRRTRDPYRIWIAEIMLQQTRVETAVLYYERFLQRFPDVETLAATDLQEVLSVWQGLGYYRRAEAMHVAARKIVLKYKGKLPVSVKELMDLPGIGAYTARAVASLAFGIPVGVVDGNVRRVLSRLFRLERPRPSRLQNLMDTLVDPQDPGTFNQAMMELGAKVCLSHSPKCNACPVRNDCQGFLSGSPASFPLPTTNKRTRIESFWVILWSHRWKWLLGHNRDSLLHDMWLFPMWPQQDYPDLASFLHPILAECCRPYDVNVRRLPITHHSFSHRTWVMVPIWVEWPGDAETPNIENRVVQNFRNLKWFSRARIATLPIPRAHRKIFDLIARGNIIPRPLMVADQKG